MKKLKNVDMLNGSLYLNMLAFAIPLMTSSILQLLFNAADIIVVGRYAGDQSMAAVSSCGALINLIVNIFVGLSVGANVVTARMIGADDSDGVHRSSRTAVTLSFTGGILLMVIGFFVAPKLLTLMDSPADVLPLASLYLKMYFIGMPGLMMYNFGSALLRASGDTRRPMYFLTIAGIANVLMNLFFVIVLKMEAAGVGLATALSQYISGYLILRSLMKNPSALHVDLRDLGISRSELTEMARIGLPAGFQGMLFSLSNVVIQASVNSFGSIVMAGNGAAANIEGFVYVGMNALHQGCLTFTSQNMGAGKIKRIREILVTSVVMVSVIGIILGVGSYMIGETLLSIYSNDPLVIEAGMHRLLWVDRIYFICGIMDVLVGSLRGIGMSIMPMIVSLLGVCGFRLLWISTVFAANRVIDIVYISYPISWILTGGVHLICFIYGYRKLLRQSA